jgi:hypothetical protein
MAIRLAAGIDIRSAKPPGLVMPIIVRFEHKLSRPVTQ